jgi:RNA polymerase sigma-70 factor (ECF subfamily)
MKKEQQAADNLYKTHFGKLVLPMLQFSRDINLETAEDLVQDSFVAALTSWKKLVYRIIQPDGFIMFAV